MSVVFKDVESQTDLASYEDFTKAIPCWTLGHQTHSL